MVTTQPTTRVKRLSPSRVDEAYAPPLSGRKRHPPLGVVVVAGRLQCRAPHLVVRHLQRKHVAGRPKLVCPHSPACTRRHKDRMGRLKAGHHARVSSRVLPNINVVARKAVDAAEGGKPAVHERHVPLLVLEFLLPRVVDRGVIDAKFLDPTRLFEQPNARLRVVGKQIPKTSQAWPLPLARAFFLS